MPAFTQTYPKQQEFLESNAFVRGFVGGRGTGKSTIGAIDLLNRAKAGRSYSVIAPSYVILKDATLPVFEAASRGLGKLVNKVTKTPGDMKCSIRTNDGGEASVVFRSADNPESLRGPNKSGAWLDEISLMAEASFQVVSACLREGGEMGWITGTFTPKGKRHWSYLLFYDELGAIRKNRYLVQSHSSDNPFLPAEFVELNTEIMGSQLARQELGGEFIELGGLMFRMEWFPVINHHEFLKVLPHKPQMCRYWDKAATPGGGDFTAGALLAMDNDGMFYVVDVVRGQWGAGERNRRMLQVAQDDRKRFGGSLRTCVEQEPGSGGLESAQLTMKLLRGHNISLDKVTGTKHRIKDKEKIAGEAKIIRAQPWAAQAEFMRFCLVKAHWNESFLGEVCSFPEYKYMDQVDAVSGAFNKLAPANLEGEETPRPESQSHQLESGRFGIQAPKETRRATSMRSRGGHGVGYGKRR